MRHAQIMGVLKTFGYATVVTVLAATAATPGESLLHRVTECIGRLSAQIEHNWLFPETPTDQIETQRAHLVDILDALVTPETLTHSLAARIDAKMAHAALLSQATFAQDQRTANWAQKRASQELVNCDHILLKRPPTVPVLSAPNRREPGSAVNQDTWQASQ